MAPDSSTASGGVAISVRDLIFSYETESGTLSVLDGVDFDISAGDVVALTGASGSGKTTLLSVLGGLDRPQSGSVIVGTDDLGLLRRDDLARLPPRDGRVRVPGFRSAGPVDRARERRVGAHDRAQLRSDRAVRGLASFSHSVGLEPSVSHRPRALSGGEKQRVAIARALANRPRLVLADEPTGQPRCHVDDRGARGADAASGRARQHASWSSRTTRSSRQRATDAFRSRTASWPRVRWRDAIALARRSVGRRGGRAFLTVLAVALGTALLSSLLIASDAARAAGAGSGQRGRSARRHQGRRRGAPRPTALDSDNPRPGGAEAHRRRRVGSIRELPDVASVVPVIVTPIAILPPVRHAAGRAPDGGLIFDVGRRRRPSHG